MTGASCVAASSPNIYFPRLEERSAEGLNETERILLFQMDPDNVTVEPEHYADADPERYAPVKPLLWLWEMFDRSLLGENVHLGVLFRRILARRIFRSCGKDFKAFPPGQILVRVQHGRGGRRRGPSARAAR